VEGDQPGRIRQGTICVDPFDVIGLAGEVVEAAYRAGALGQRVVEVPGHRLERRPEVEQLRPRSSSEVVAAPLDNVRGRVCIEEPAALSQLALVERDTDSQDNGDPPQGSTARPARHGSATASTAPF
jgi:hypothetical protein